MASLSAAAWTKTETLLRQDMLPLGHQLSIGLAHRADAAVQIVPAQWIDGILAPVVPSPFLHRLSLRQAEQLEQRLRQRVAAGGAGVSFLGENADRPVQEPVLEAAECLLGRRAVGVGQLAPESG